MANKTSEAIFGQVFDRVLETVSKRTVPVTAGNEEAVAKAVTREIAPVVVNATNSEPWYQSRIFRGLLVAALGFLGTKIGLVIGEADVVELIEIGGALFEAGGLAYAWYGRVVGASKKPLGQ